MATDGANNIIVRDAMAIWRKLADGYGAIFYIYKPW